METIAKNYFLSVVLGQRPLVACRVQRFKKKSSMICKKKKGKKKAQLNTIHKTTKRDKKYDTYHDKYVLKI